MNYYSFQPWQHAPSEPVADGDDDAVGGAAAFTQKHPAYARPCDNHRTGDGSVGTAREVLYFRRHGLLATEIHLVPAKQVDCE